MTLAPTNEAIRHETSGKKTLTVKVKKNDRLAGLSRNRCKDRFLSKSVRFMRAEDFVRVNQYLLRVIYFPHIHQYRVLLSGYLSVMFWFCVES